VSNMFRVDGLKDNPLPWLLEDDPENPGPRWFALTELLESPYSDPEVVAARQAVATAGPVPAILNAQDSEGYWVEPGPGYYPKYRGTAWSIIFLAQLGEAYAVAGKVGEAREVLRQLEELSRQRYVSPYHLAYVYTGLGEQDTAIDWLERAYQERAGAVYGVKGSFLFTTLRSHPRFTALLKRMNLT